MIRCGVAFPSSGCTIAKESNFHMLSGIAPAGISFLMHAG
jgi:hypothetical protein